MRFIKQLFQKEEDILTTYLRIADDERWEEALPVIEEIVSKNEGISTSWFNYAVCLEGLNRYEDAIDAFKRAYEIEPFDKGIQYRIFRALALKKDAKEFTRFAEAEIVESPEILGLLQEQEEFQEMVQHKWFLFRMEKYVQQDSCLNSEQTPPLHH